MTNLETLLTELESAGWSVSWAFQFAPGHWRVSLLKESDGENHFRCCADAPSFATALEYAFIRGEELITYDEAPVGTVAPKVTLADALGLLKSKSTTPIRRI